jgi:hypothetical protein
MGLPRRPRLQQDNVHVWKFREALVRFYATEVIRHVEAQGDSDGGAFEHRGVKTFHRTRGRNHAMLASRPLKSLKRHRAPGTIVHPRRPPGAVCG